MNPIVPATGLPRVVIVGGGFGGIQLARELQQQPFQVVLLDQNNYFTFQPLLYQVSTGGLEPDSIAFPLRKIFERQEQFFFRNAKVLSIRAEENVLETSIGELSFDYLVLATGSKTNYFGMNLEGKAMGMKNIPEALNLRSLILQNFEEASYTSDPVKKSALMKFVVVGGGPSGVETAGALAELKRFVLPNDYPELDLRQMEIHLVEAGPCLLAGMSAFSSAGALQGLEEMGVHVWLNTRVMQYEQNVIQTNQSLHIETDTVIWTAGVIGNPITGIPETCIDRRSNRIAVNSFNQISGFQNLFAIGDVALLTEDPAYPKGHPQVAQPAIQQASLLAQNLPRLFKGQPLEPFRYQDLGSMATIGRNKAVVDLGKWQFKGMLAWFLWMILHLWLLLGFRNRLVVFANWAWSYFTYDRGARVIIRPFQKHSKT